VNEPERPRRTDVVDLGRSIEAVTLDFGNTLVPFPGGARDQVLWTTAERAAAAWGFPAAEFVRLWAEERLRQLAEDVPEGLEADMDVRAARVLARLRGHPGPADGERWDDARVRVWSSPEEVEIVLDAYASAFVRLTPVPPEIGPLLTELAANYRVAILSNWPIAIALERFVEAAGWSPHLRAVVTSQRVGSIKPLPQIFWAAAQALGVASGPRLLHAGDDMGADVGGAHAVGWRTAWLRSKPEDSVLPVAPILGNERPDVILDRVVDLPGALGLRRRSRP
jgi:FMN phosphatase YigB (HAD superfamily)